MTSPADMDTQTDSSLAMTQDVGCQVGDPLILSIEELEQQMKLLRMAGHDYDTKERVVQTQVARLCSQVAQRHAYASTSSSWAAVAWTIWVVPQIRVPL